MKKMAHRLLLLEQQAEQEGSNQKNGEPGNSCQQRTQKSQTDGKDKKSQRNPPTSAVMEDGFLIQIRRNQAMTKDSILPDEYAAKTDDGQGSCIKRRNGDAVGILVEQVGGERQKDHRQQQGQIEPQQRGIIADERAEHAVMGHPIRPPT